MKIKFIFPLLMILVITMILSGCNGIQGFPKTMELEDSIREIISSKNSSYDFLNDELYMNKMQELVDLLVKNNIINKEHFKLGNLDDDNIPELIVFRERNPEDKNDEGRLEVYKFNGEKYDLLDSVSMNYDNTNYQLIVGKISETQNGIYLNNQVGAHSGITYGFVLEEGSLVSILDDKKINLLSVYTSNEIKDIDNDGILEFSIYTLDPETSDLSSVDSDKIRLWYKWDEKDSGTLIKIERKKGSGSPNKKISDVQVLNELEKLLKSEDLSFIHYMKENKDKLSPRDNTALLIKYLSLLKEESNIRKFEINNLFSKYQLGFSHDHLFKKYGLSLDRLNDLEYLNREKILNTEEELKVKLIDNLNIGYKLDSIEGTYEYVIDYKKILDEFSEDILKEYRDYLKILALNTNKPYLNDGNLMISMEKLASRIVLLENFRMTYPYSIYLDEINQYYKDYINTFIFGSINNPNFDNETKEIKEDILESFKQVIDEYPHTSFADIVQNLLIDLGNNGNKLNNEIENKYNLLLK